jgi:hypothetical protein
LQQWLERFRPDTQIGRDLVELAGRLNWERQPKRTYAAASTVYLYASPATLFWAYTAGLHREDLGSIGRLLSAV